MITSSKFFNKSFFTIQQQSQQLSTNQICPWDLRTPKISQEQFKNHKYSPQQKYLRKQNSNQTRGYQISRNSSLKYEQKKLRQRAMLNRSSKLPPIEDIQQLSQIKSTQKYKTIQQKLKPILQKNTIQYTDSIDIFMNKQKKSKRKSHVFPQVTINQYNDLKAKGSSLLSPSSLQHILQRRKYRRKLIQQFGTNLQNKNIANLRKSNKSNSNNKSQTIQTKNCASVLSGRYVCAIKNPQFSVYGMPTTKFIDQY